MKKTRRFGFWLPGIILFVAFLVAATQPGVAQAGTDDVLLGAASSNVSIDPADVTSDNFDTYFTYKDPPESSLTIGGDEGDAQIGAMWTGGTEGDWRAIRVVIDSNGDDSLDPFDWGSATHPWNRPDNGTPDNPDDDPTEWTYTYPDNYPGSEAGDTITITWNETEGYVEDFPWDTFQWWWYESDYDKTDQWWMERGQLMNIWWSGRDMEWHVLPNGNYKVQVWVDEDDDLEFEDTEANKTMIIKIETASITGKVVDKDGNAIEGAEVEAGSHKAWGEARTDSNGEFTVSGLESGASYHIRVRASGKVTFEKDEDVEIPADATTADAGTIAMDDAISITGTLKLDVDADETAGEDPDDKFTTFTNQWGWEQNELWVWIDGWNKEGPGWGNTDVRFLDAGHADFSAGDDLSVDFTLNIPPPSDSTTYQLNFHVEGYAASSKDVTVTSTGGEAGTIVLTKASVLTGSVKLPAAISEWRNIDVQAVNKDDSDDRYWGWGQVEGTEDTPKDTGNFRIDGVPAGTFNLQVRVWGYKETTQEIEIVQGVDKDVGEITIEQGNAITGTLTIEGDTTNLKRWEGDDEDPMWVWIDAWSHTAGWGGTNVQVARGTDKSASYTIGGLSSGTFELHCWIGEGYDLVDEDGNSPVMVTVSSSAEQNLVLKPFEGKITGTISGDGVTVDLEKVVVEVKRPWDWLPPKYVKLGSGITDTGTYTVSGLGTDDFVVRAGMYTGFIDNDGNEHEGIGDYEGEGRLMADSTVGAVMERVFVQNGESTTCDITFEQGYSVSGTISLSTSDSPWHDFGDGTFNDEGKPAGDPNKKKDTNDDKQKSEVIDLQVDLDGKMIMAMPMEMMFMGGSDPRVGKLQYDADNDVCTYQIKGLAPGVYIIQPPFSSDRINNLTEEETKGEYFHGGEETHHWATTTQMVVITDQDLEGKNFTLSNGYTITGELTVPEAQTAGSEDWDQWWWVGHLELETPTGSFLGHGKPLFKKDFNDGTKYDFTFNHVKNGDYLVRFWTDRYVPGTAKVTVSNANTSVNLDIEMGANLVGKLVDADTGEAITSADGVMVTCEAYPWVEGSWKETRDDDWSLSYIENDEGLQSGDTGGTEGKRVNKTPGKFHLNALPTGHKYVVIVETTCGESKAAGAKNYVGQVLAGIDIPTGASGDIDIGTIKLKEGTTIKGKLTDSDGNGIPGVEVCAIPSDPHSGSAEAWGDSDTNGYYTIYGIDPDENYYDLIAAERPFLFEDWGKKIEWGQKFKYNIPPGTTADDEIANFTLGRTTATLSGTLTIPSDSEFMLPFKGEGEEFPVGYIILQRKGVIYKDVLEGIEGMTTPKPSTATTADYTIDNIEPGKYKIFFMNYGLPTKVMDNVTISEGSNDIDHEWTSAGYKRSGSCGLSDGGYPSTADISGVICMDTSDQSLIFGQLTQEADGTYSAYEVPGLADGQEYQLVFYKESGTEDMPDVFPVGDPFTVAGADTTYDATISRNLAPIMMMQAIQDSDDSSKFNIAVFSTTYLVDESIGVVTDEPTADSTDGEIYIKQGDGSLSSVTLSGDKRNISATYTKAAGDDDVQLKLAVHYGSESTTKLVTLSFNVNAVAMNGDIVNVYTAGQVKLGHGDGSQIYLPAGSLDTETKAEVSISESTEEPGAASLSRSSQSEADKRGVFSRSALAALPSGVTSAGNQYDFSAKEAGGTTEVSVKSGATVTVQIEYDPNKVSDVSQLNVWHLVEGTWTKEDTNRTVDTENKTISVEVTKLSPFVSGSGSTTTTTTEEEVTSGSGISVCFIATAASGSPLEKHGQVQMILLALAMAGLLAVRLAGQQKKK